MQHVAAEMQRDDWFRVKKIPLLIGGATTSRVHTAVKIAPHYEGPVVYVPDASRSVGVCADLLSDQRAAKFITDLTADYERVRALHAAKKPRCWSRWRRRVPTRRRSTGAATCRRSPSSSAGACSATTTWPNSRACIDWGPFFQTWDLAGKFPEHPARRGGRRRSHARVERRPPHAAAPDRGPLAERARRDRPVAGQHGGRRLHRDLRRRVAQRGGAALVAAAHADRAAGDRRRATPQPLPGRLRRAARRAR